jgi:mRNA (guanine-N7-)-methyltransferase
MGCGKGGDLNKWQKAKVKEYVGVGACANVFPPPVPLVLIPGLTSWFISVDIADVSIQQARSRYMQSATSRSSKGGSQLTASFFALDCYSNPLTDVIPPTSLPPMAEPFDVVSMQFCMHYAFENVQKARMMLENVTKWLRPGGVFVGTIPNDKLLL